MILVPADLQCPSCPLCPDAVQCSPCCPVFLRRVFLNQTFSSSSHELCNDSAGWGFHSHQTDSHFLSGASRGAEREPHARRASRLRVTLQGAGSERSLRRLVPAAAPPIGQRDPERWAELQSSCSLHPGQDATAVEQRPEPGQKPALPRRIQTRQHGGGEASIRWFGVLITRTLLNRRKHW